LRKEWVSYSSAATLVGPMGLSVRATEARSEQTLVLYSATDGLEVKTNTSDRNGDGCTCWLCNCNDFAAPPLPDSSAVAGTEGSLSATAAAASRHTLRVFVDRSVIEVRPKRRPNKPLTLTIVSQCEILQQNFQEMVVAPLRNSVCFLSLQAHLDARLSITTR
jgi:hypothetical protein